MIDPAATPETTSGVDPAAISAYLDTIYPPDWGWRGQISVAHSLPDGTGMPSLRLPRLAGAGTTAMALAEFARSAQSRRAPGVYLRCSTVRAELAAGKRGGVAHAVELPGLWADLDIDGPGHKHDPAKHGGLLLAQDEDQAAKIVDAAGLPEPSLWVHSGGGLYAWWLFDRKVELDGPGGEDTRPYWSAVSAAWQARLVAGAKTLGLHYGPVGNLDRVMGLVGTTNAKPGTMPVMRRMLGGVGARHAPEALAQVLDLGKQGAPGVESRGLPEAAQLPSGALLPPPGAAASGLVPSPRDSGRWATEDGGPLAASTLREIDHISPLDDFEAKHTWWQILGPLGWTLVKGDPAGGPCDWRRPGASHPLSATTGKDASRDRMWVFSDSAGLPTSEPLTKGYVYAQLYHDGDMSAAGRALVEMGYGSAGRARLGGTAGAGTGTRGAAGGTVGAASAPRRLELTAASRMEMRAARWLWAEDGAHWLPLGGVCLLGGREGRGKSTWTYRLIAQVTQGTLPGDLEGEPRSAVIAASEDDWEHTIVPRLLAAGADLDRVHRVDAVEPDRRTGVILPDDLAAMGELLARNPEVALLVLDPIVSVIPARTDSHKDHEVRKALEPISALAHGLGITVLGLIHDNKSTGTDLSTRLMGSRAFVAVARAALVCVEEPDDEGGEENSDAAGADPDRVDEGDGGPLVASGVSPIRFLLGQVKNNLEAKAPWSIRYVIKARTVGRDEAVGKDIRASYVQRVGRSLARLEDRMRAAERPAGTGDGAKGLRASQEALRKLLAGGPLTLTAIRARIADVGVSWKTVERAARAMREDGELMTVRAQGGYCWSLVKGTLSQDPTETLEGDEGGEGMRVMRVEGGASSLSTKEWKEGPFSEGGHPQDRPHPQPSTSPRARELEGQENVKSGDGLRLGACCSQPGGSHVPWCRSAGAA